MHPSVSFVVTTPSGTHFEIARQILEAGRHVVVDKPVCTDISRSGAAYAACSARNLLLVPFHNRRWDGDFQTVRRVIDEGSLGRLVSFESRFDRWRPDISHKIGSGRRVSKQAGELCWTWDRISRIRRSRFLANLKQSAQKCFANATAQVRTTLSRSGFVIRVST